MERKDIIALAASVGQAIKNSDIMAEFEEAGEAYDADEELQSMIREYSTNQEALTRAGADETADEILINALSDRIDELYGEISRNEAFERYSKAQDALSALLNEINSVISERAMGGVSSGGCSGNCSTCGGCR